MTTLENFVSPALTRALGWTLLHSLWQGAVVAAVLAGALLLLRRQRAEVRYAASAGALGLVVALAGITFGLYFSSSPGKDGLPGLGAAKNEPATSAASKKTKTLATNVLAAPDDAVVVTPEAQVKQPRHAAATAGASVAVAQAAPSATPSFIHSLIRALNNQLPLLVLGWLLGLLAMSLRLLGGLLYVQRLRRYRVRPLSAEWQQRLTTLAARSGVKRPVALLESALVQVPLVVGHLRPMILLPLGTVAGLSAAQLEAILAHELAHVLRRDYLVNLLQTVAEAVFFYHPAVWFVARCVRTERENCCDDTATALVGGDPLRLARALTALAEWSQSATVAPAPRLALAAIGRRGALLSRVRRLVTRRPAAPTLAEGIMAGALVLGGLGLLGGGVALAGPLAAQLRLPSGRQTTPPDTTKRRTKPVDAAAAAPSPMVPAVAAPPPSPPRPNPDERPTGTEPLPTVQAGPPPGTVVITRDKKGRLTDLTVNGRRVEPAQLSKAERRAGRQVTVLPLPPAPGEPRSGAGRPDEGGRKFDREMSRKMGKAADKLDKAGAGPYVYVGSGPDGGNIHIDIDNEALDQLTSSAVALGNVSLNFGLKAAAQGLEQARRELEATLRDPHLHADVRRATRQALEETRRELAQTRRPAAAADRKREAENRAQEAENRKMAAEDRAIEAHDSQQEVQERRRELQERLRETQQELKDLEQGKADATRAGRDREQANQDRDQARRDRDQADRDRNEALTDQLLKDGLINDRNNFQVKLTARSLTVNGQEQPTKVQQKYLKQYESTGRKMSATGAMVMNHSGSSSSSFSHSGPPSPPRAPQMAPPAPPRPPGLGSDELREELRRDGVIGANDKQFQLQLNDAGLTVNGKKQPADLAAKYRRLTGHEGGKNFNITMSVEE